MGFQIGATSTDLILLVMSERGADKLLSSRFTLGGEGSVAAGPVGRTVTAQTDAQMRAEMLSWSRAQGLFAGIALEGATLRQDLDDNATLYGKRLENRDIVTTGVRAPEAAAKLLAMLNRYRPENVPSSRVCLVPARSGCQAVTSIILDWHFQRYQFPSADIEGRASHTRHILLCARRSGVHVACSRYETHLSCRIDVDRARTGGARLPGDQLHESRNGDRHRSRACDRGSTEDVAASTGAGDCSGGRWRGAADRRRPQARVEC